MIGLQNWLRQPTTVAGLSTLVGTLLAMSLHQLGFVQAGPLLAGALISIILPDNGGARGQAEALATELLRTMTDKPPGS